MIFKATVLLALLGHVISTDDHWINYLSPTSLGYFYNDQKTKVQQVQDSVNSYIEDQQKSLSDSFNTYVDNVQDSWSFVSDERSLLDNPDMVLSVPSIISRHGYPCEVHIVQSKGYVLNVHRIPHSKSSGEISSKTIILQHGLLASSADWILNGPEKALAYVLADAGYDVWMPNIRGNRYSKEHVRLKTDSKAYWDFSWHEVAQHDVPAVIDYIVNLKGSDAGITYIGHSMGTSILFAMLTLRPEYNGILKAGFALAPVAFLTDLKSILRGLVPMAQSLANINKFHGSYEFITKETYLGQMMSACDVENINFGLCEKIVFDIVGHNEQQLNKTLLPVFLSHLGTGTSWKTVLHFTQEVQSGKFQQYDYGMFDNIKAYGTKTPPEYDLSKITLPLTLFWSENDLLSSEKDVMLLKERLQADTELYLIPDPKFNHLDYIWAVDAPRLVNDKVLESLEKVYTEHRKFRFNIRFK